MRALPAVAALAAVVIACADSSGDTLAPSLDEATPAEPSKDPAGACPAKFSLTAAYKQRADMRYVGRDPADDNQDSYVCLLITKEPTASSLGVTVVLDNNLPPDQIGKCPLTFTAYAVFSADEDLNGNSVVCKAVSEDVGLVTVDDNDR